MLSDDSESRVNFELCTHIPTTVQHWLQRDALSAVKLLLIWN